MPNWPSQVGKWIVSAPTRLWDTLVHDKMPVWLSIVLIVVGAGGTYCLAPTLNASFETSKMRAAYLLENLKAQNNDIGILLATVGRAIQAGQPNPQDFAAAREAITKIQWRVIEYRVALPAPRAKETFDKFTSATSTVGAALTDYEKAANNEQIQALKAALETFIRSSAELTNFVTRNARVTIADR